MKAEYTIKQVQVYYLRMDNKPAFVISEGKGLSVEEMPKPIDIDGYLKLYTSVGKEYNWIDRLEMPKDLLINIINNSKTHVLLFKVNGTLAGWAELVEGREYVELLYFGLLPEFVGKGLGKSFLAMNINKAWELNPAWIQLNTCSLDHPNAINVYKSLGFVEYKREFEMRKVFLRE
ncbi:MAG TPA: GNAT family N-acetyltransferase [Bacteroidales bacterium]